MTTAENAFTALDGFLDRLERLVNAAPPALKLAQRLRAEKQLDTGIKALVDALNILASALKKLQEPLKKAEHLAAGCEAIAESLDAFGDGKSLGKVAKLCGQSDGVVEAIVDRIVQVRGPLNAALSMLGSLPTPSELTGLCKHLTDLAGDLRALQLKVENPNGHGLVRHPG